ncbi:hypothetical protein Tco_0940942 [Tanacetum coccineum]|uniref:Uncharacterized protein n=1 Tax=Tanacetum coccineum TaxID=301880 RepID=A0ABQ5DQ48_9ASTR
MEWWLGPKKRRVPTVTNIAVTKRAELGVMAYGKSVALDPKRGCQTGDQLARNQRGVGSSKGWVLSGCRSSSLQDMRTLSRYVIRHGFRSSLIFVQVVTARQHKTDVKGTTSSVPKTITDNGKRKVKTCDDSNVFQAYSALCARNVRPHCLSNVPEPADVPNFGGTQNDSCDVFEKYTNMCDRLLADNDNLTSPFIPSKDTTTICPSGSTQHGRARGKTQPTPPPVEAVDRLSIGMADTVGNPHHASHEQITSELLRYQRGNINASNKDDEAELTRAEGSSHFSAPYFSSNRCCAPLKKPLGLYPKTDDVSLTKDEKKIWKEFQKFDKDTVGVKWGLKWVSFGAEMGGLEQVGLGADIGWSVKSQKKGELHGSPTSSSLLLEFLHTTSGSTMVRNICTETPTSLESNVSNLQAKEATEM